jgi:hypothetical protein
MACRAFCSEMSKNNALAAQALFGGQGYTDE